MCEKIEREVINGKPHFGTWCGRFIYIPGNHFSGEDDTNPIYQEGLKILRFSFSEIKLKYPQFEQRHYQEIIKSPCSIKYLNAVGTIGYKFLAWGRAYEIMKLFKKGSRRYKKVFVNGRRKLKRYA
jgi:hypothetical protein